MNYTAKLEHFEGPLDLLLQLIERSELEITQITLSSITTQYLAYIHELQDVAPDDLQQFTGLATKLLYLKSVALLPTLATDEQDEELSDLAEQLQQYRNYSKAASYLENLLKSRTSFGRPVKLSLPPGKQPLPKLDLTTLAAVFQQEVAKLPELPTANIESQMSLEEGCTKVLDAAKQKASLQQLFKLAGNRYEALVLFLALLELIKNDAISASQAAAHSEIQLSHVTAQPVATT